MLSDRYGHFIRYRSDTQFAFAHLVYRTGRFGEHVVAPLLHADMVGAGENVVADEHGRVRAPQGIDRRGAAPYEGFVHYVVMDQRCGMQHFDERGAQVAARADFTVQGRREQYQQRTHLFAAVCEDVVADRGDIAAVAVENFRDERLVAADLVGDGLLYLL